MIISASRRTDIPAYYSDWLLHRLQEGYVLTRNPMNHAQVSRVNLSPDVVDCIVFWTKDPLKIMSKLESIEAMGYRYYFQFTLTPYESDLEKNIRDKRDIIDTFVQLSKRLGKERVLWRYDPIILNDYITIAYHRENFLRMCEKLAPYTESVTISVVHLYPKLKTSLIRPIHPEELAELSRFFGRTAREYNLVARACSESTDLSRYGIEQASCIDKALVERVCGYPLNLKPDNNQRPSCGCYESIDIGVYNTCLHNCVYCYANRSITSARKNFQAHDPRGELLLGAVGEGNKIRVSKVKSHRASQLSIF